MSDRFDDGPGPSPDRDHTEPTQEAPDLPAWLLEILVCPVDRHEVHLDGKAVVCPSCRWRYEVREGIPVMIPTSEMRT